MHIPLSSCYICGAYKIYYISLQALGKRLSRVCTQYACVIRMFACWKYRKSIHQVKGDLVWTTRAQDNSYPGQLAPKTTCTQVNPYPRQFVPKTTRTQDNSYPRNPIPRTTRNQVNVPRSPRNQDNSYPGQFLPMTTRTQDSSYPGHVVSKTTDTR